MNPQNDLSDRQKLRRGIAFHRALNIGNAATNTVLVLIVGYLVLHDTTKIVPPLVQRPYEIGANYANKEYLLDTADYVLRTLNTVTPGTVEHNNKVILKMVDPDGSATLKTELDAAAMRIKREGITTVWEPRTEQVSESDKWVRYKGTYKTYIADKLTSSREREFLVQFSITISGRLYVQTVKEIVRNDSGKPAAT